MNTLTLSQPIADLRINILEAAVRERTDALALSMGVVAVTNPTELADAVAAAGLLKQLQKQMEETRVAVKAPVLSIGKRIDATAKGYSDALALEQARLEKLASDYQAGVLRIADELRRDELAKLEQEAAVDFSPDAMYVRHERRLELEQPIRVEGARVKQAWDYEVEDIRQLASAHPNLVKIEPRRAEILAFLNFQKCEPSAPGLRVFQSTKVQATA